jgi:hypothetical protein
MARRSISLFAAAFQLALPVSAVEWPLQIHEDSRFLEDQNGVPFHLRCDAGWMLTNATTDGIPDDDIADYLDDLQGVGGNCVLILGPESRFGAVAGANAAGDSAWGTNSPDPFVTYTDPTAAAYWAYTDQVIGDMRDRGMLAMLAPAYLGSACNHAYATNINNLTPQEATGYGRWLADRYDECGMDDICGNSDDFGNVMFVWGGDTAASASGCGANVEARHQSMYDAARAEWPGGLHTGMAQRYKRGSVGYPFMDSAAQGDTDNLYSACNAGSRDTFAEQARAAWNDAPTLPHFAIEGRYVFNANTCTDSEHHAQFWHSLLGGGMGYVSGNEGVWCFDRTELGPCARFSTGGAVWRDNLNADPVLENAFPLASTIDALNGVELENLVPDWPNTVLTAGFGNINADEYSLAATSTTAMVAYVHDNANKTFDFSGLGTVDCNWHKADTGAVTAEGLETGVRVLKAPTNADYILVCVAAACSNGLDDDGDGLADYPADTGCFGPLDPSEKAPDIPCDDGVDNDGDTFVDFPADPDCLWRFWVSEEAQQCSDGLDNDGDTLTDYPADPGCGWLSPWENPECSDLIDNDGDTLVDQADPECAEPWFRKENPACSDGIDNDGDGLIDLADPGCMGAFETQESTPYCGLGYELIFLVLPLLLVRERWRRSRGWGDPRSGWA